MLHEIEAKMFALGWVRSPNNCLSLPSIHWQENDPDRDASPVWYPGCGGIPCPIKGEVQVKLDRIRVFETKLFGEPYTRCTHHDHVTLAVFDSVESFVEHCKTAGRLSEPGAPAYSAGGD